MVVYAYSDGDSFADELLPSNNEDAGQFSSMELSPSVPKNGKRAARPFFSLIYDILDTVYTSTKADAKRSQFKGSRYTK